MTDFHKSNYRYIKVYEILPPPRWHSAPCPEGFSPGTPVSLIPIFLNSNLTKLVTYCGGPTEIKNSLITRGKHLYQFVTLCLFPSYTCTCGFTVSFAAVILVNEQIGKKLYYFLSSS